MCGRVCCTDLVFTEGYIKNQEQEGRWIHFVIYKKKVECDNNVVRIQGWLEFSTHVLLYCIGRKGSVCPRFMTRLSSAHIVSPSFNIARLQYEIAKFWIPKAQITLKHNMLTLLIHFYYAVDKQSNWVTKLCVTYTQ